LSVGNLTVGGTGKTPCTLWLLERAAEHGVEAAILTRGYGGDGNTNDEIDMVRARFPKVGIGVGGDRVASAAALRAANPNIRAFVLDDGFQHRRVARDLDVVLVDATDPFGGGACLPGGRLREPKVGIRRAGAVVVTRADQAERAAVDALWRELAAIGYRGPRVEAVHEPEALVPLGGAGEGRPAAWLRGRRVRLLSAIARPGSFERTIRALGGAVAEHRAFRDHHRYMPAELPDLRDRDGESWCVTEKDAPKLRRLGAVDGWVLRVRFRVTVGEGELRALVGSALGR
jgi:tetraacyldisaccharide 4'-kinase